MEWIKCKNDAEKLEAIKAYCNHQIQTNNCNIKSYRLDQSSPLDYADEIHELELANKRFEKILEIINADEFTSIPTY